jgi:hypothetical protein
VNHLPTAQGASDTQEAEAGTLARELAAAYKGLVENYRDVWKKSTAEAVVKAEEVSDGYAASILKGPADQASWSGLDYLARQDVAAAARRWEEVKAEALAELRSGHRAAKAMEGYGSNCWARARFLAVRRDLMDAWQPRNGIERQLLDMLAQAQTAQLHWLEILTLRCASNSVQRDEGRWQAVTVEDAEAMEQAAGMVERFNAMFLRTLKALRDLRRQVPGVVVQNAGQVNVSGQQLNLNAGNGQGPTLAAAITCDSGTRP